MKRISEADWEDLARSHPFTVTERYRSRLAEHGAFLEVAPAEQGARELLDALVAHGHLETRTRQTCPACRAVLEDDALREKRCACGFSFEHDQPENQRIYFRPGRRTRDPRWLVTVHGMNTYGPWQEEFSWKLAQIYGYAIPVAIYKYGRILVSPFLLISQEHYARRFVARLQSLRLEMEDGGYGDRPDVVAHSFGTWLLARALELDPDLRLGRVVLTGSIIPPDFPWQRFLTGDMPRVEAVLCHYGGRDRVVPLAQFFVPFAGPSGRRGFNTLAGDDGRLRHHFEPGFGHSSYFATTHLSSVMDAVWGPFFVLPEPELASSGDMPGAKGSRPWRGSHLAVLTHIFKYGLLVALASLFVGAGIALVLGLPGLFHLLRGGP